MDSLAALPNPCGDADSLQLGQDVSTPNQSASAANFETTSKETEIQRRLPTTPLEETSSASAANLKTSSNDADVQAQQPNTPPDEDTSSEDNYSHLFQLINKDILKDTQLDTQTWRGERDTLRNPVGPNTPEGEPGSPKPTERDSVTGMSPSSLATTLQFGGLFCLSCRPLPKNTKKHVNDLCLFEVERI